VPSRAKPRHEGKKGTKERGKKIHETASRPLAVSMRGEPLAIDVL
jgi:hypothetical protein